MNRNRLEQIIANRIKGSGPITFETFMALSLYHTDFGYYMTEKFKIGPQGDYYTAPHIHPIFGWLVANQLDEIKRVMGNPAHFTVLEMGAGRGLLAEGILDFVRTNLKWGADWQYIIVEQNPHTRQRQRDQLAAHRNRIIWKTALEEVDPFCGCVVSNELLDSFPVHLVAMNGHFREIYVDSADSGFKEIYKDLSTPDLADYIELYRIPALRGYRTEINLNIRKYLQQLDNLLAEGFVVSIDYGYSARDYYSAERSRGTLVCYYRHQVNQNPYLNIGDQDISSHVNFTSVRDWGKNLGLKSLGYSPQGVFLASLGIDEIVTRELESHPDFIAELPKIKGLLFGMGDTHKVLIQYKGKRDPGNLRGFALKNSLSRL
jgi:SAM-dependent MidA family methyltransferase